MSEKTYCAIFHFSSSGLVTALNFQSFAEAKSYILEASELICIPILLKCAFVLWPSENHCRFLFVKGAGPIDATIKEYPISAVKFELRYLKNGECLEVRRFTKRELAVNRAHKILDDLGYEPEEYEDDWGGVES